MAHISRGLITIKTRSLAFSKINHSNKVFHTQVIRRTSSYSAAGHSTHGSIQASQSSSGLDRLPTGHLLRNLILGVMLTSPMMSRIGLNTMTRLAESRWTLLNPDKNPLLRLFIKPLIYDQFCAGTIRDEICRTRDCIKSMGYSGVVLCYGKEIQVSKSAELHSTGDIRADAKAEIEQFRQGNLETLAMVGEGDWLGIKLTGAGYAVTEALMNGQEPPAEFTQAIDDICNQARSQNCRIWIDAEQQVLQKTIDQWVIGMMRRHNTDGQALVYNTLQAYLKEARSKLQDQIKLASAENWTLAIKLVRGAYMANDQREKIHDTKQGTDDTYNGIVNDLLTGQAQASAGSPEAKMQLILAGHNPESIHRAIQLISTLSFEKKLKVMPDFGQLQGMADGLGCQILQRCTKMSNDTQSPVPKIYKCLTWGSIQECMQYLVRRLVENKSGADRMRDGLPLYYAELKRRFLRREMV